MVRFPAEILTGLQLLMISRQYGAVYNNGVCCNALPVEFRLIFGDDDNKRQEKRGGDLGPICVSLLGVKNAARWQTAAARKQGHQIIRLLKEMGFWQIEALFILSPSHIELDFIGVQWSTGKAPGSIS